MNRSFRCVIWNKEIFIEVDIQNVARHGTINQEIILIYTKINQNCTE